MQKKWNMALGNFSNKKAVNSNKMLSGTLIYQY
jgi:hypothetical protein